MELPLLIAGPMLRRAETCRVLVWAATSRAAEVTVTVVDGSARQLGRAVARAVTLGPRLVVHLAEVTPDDEAFPVRTLLGYDLCIDAGDGSLDLDGLGLLDGPDRIPYDGLALPTFFLRSEELPLGMLHGSCRLLHGNGEDAMAAADEAVGRAATDLSARPCVLLLTGDQIYADDVAGALIGQVRALATALCGHGDITSVPGVPALDGVAVDARGPLAEAAAFTSDKADNHLLSFGEYVAMHLLAFSPAPWPAQLPTADEAAPAGASARERRRYERHRDALIAARRTVPAVRRLLANVATYMVFDDHDVTDDWNLTGGWRQRVHDSPTGRRVIANALAAFWAFQGWGNAPSLFDEAFVEMVAGFTAGRHDDAERFERTLWDHDRWSYVAPTEPPTLMLDTRTQRTFEDAEDAAVLIGPAERTRVARLLADAGHRPGAPLTLVSPVPVFGLELGERRQKYLVGKVGPYEIDFEAWHSNLDGLVDFMRLLVDDLELSEVLVLSGDVHYGLNVDAAFHLGERRLRVLQLVSSSFKHSGAASRAGLATIGTVVSATHRRLGWAHPPSLAEVHGLRRWLLSRPANTDAWDVDSAVFLYPGVAGWLGIDQPPDYREQRTYLRPSHNGRSVLVGANNVGLVTLTGDRVTHDLLTRVDGRTITRSVNIVPRGGPGGT